MSKYILIPVLPKTGEKFEDLQIKLKRKKVLKTKDELVDLLVDFYNKNFRGCSK